MRSNTLLLWILLSLLSACSTANPFETTSNTATRPTATPTTVPHPDEMALRQRDKALAIIAQAPNDPAALRDALDLAAIGLADAPPGPLRIELAALRDQLVAQLSTTPVAVSQAIATTAMPTPAAVAPSRNSTAAPKPRPATPVPAPATQFSVAERRSYEGSGVTGDYNSCIDIQVLGRNGPLPGAVIGINNGDLNYQNQTDGNGYSGRCGLGPSTWSVVLFWVPGSGDVRNATTTVYLNGSAEQRAAVVFRER